MDRRYDFGRRGEEKAVAYLEKAGYIVLERNWRIGHKEIDILCTDGDLLIVVEVKTRKEETEYPWELLDEKKRRNLRQAAGAYIRRNKLEKEVRFDLILVTGSDFDIRHIPDFMLIFD